MTCRDRFFGVESPRMGKDTDDELLARATQGVSRAAAELGRAAEDLARPWPRVAPDVLAEGGAAVGRAAAALRTLGDRLGAPAGPDHSAAESPAESLPDSRSESSPGSGS